jgi:IS30 family transposase
LVEGLLNRPLKPPCIYQFADIAVSQNPLTLSFLNPYKNITNTITGYYGKEFAEHKIISAGLNVDFYFAKPYLHWQDGLTKIQMD